MIGTKPVSEEIYFRIYNGKFRYAVITDLGDGEVVIALSPSMSDAQAIADKIYDGDAFVRELTERQSESI